MKIVISKILEGGINLQTMSAEPKSLLLEHGTHQATMPISDDQFEVILSLIGAGMHPEVAPSKPPAAPEPPKMQVPADAPPPKNGISFEPYREELEVGEVYEEQGDGYDDPETGVSAF